MLSVFTYDSRFRYTIKDLLFKPGTITRNYVEGKRLKYANPFRFFLSASIFYFVILAIISVFTGDDDFNFENDDGIVRIESSEDKEEVDLDKTIDSAAVVNLEDYKTQEKDSLEQKVDARINSGIESITTAQNTQKDEETYVYISEDSINKTSTSFINKIEQKTMFFYSFYKATDITAPSRALDSLKYEKTRTNSFLYSKINDFERIKDNPAKFIRYLASKTPFFLFFFAPLFALFFWLIYSKKKFNYMEHLVFIFHIFSWVFVVLILCLIPDALLGDNYLAAILLIFVGPFYFYKALRNFYKQKRRWTLLKFVFLNVVFHIGTTIFALIFFAITALLF